MSLIFIFSTKLQHKPSIVTTLSSASSTPSAGLSSTRISSDSGLQSNAPSTSGCPSCSGSRSTDHKLHFEPTELPLWRTSGIYDQPWAINRNMKTSVMLQGLALGERDCSRQEHDGEVEDDRGVESEAWRFRHSLKKTTSRISIQHIQGIHAKLLRGGGKFRLAGAMSRSFDGKPTFYLHPRYITSELSKLLEFYNTNNKPELSLLERFKLLGYLGAAFTAIHPFSDGNGRVCRTLLSALLNTFLPGSGTLVYLCGRKQSTRRVVFLYSLEAANGDWSEGPPTSIHAMLPPEDFTAYLIEAASQIWIEATLPLRLPRGVMPKLYNVKLRLDLEGGKLQGSVTAELDVLEATRRLHLNMAGLSIDRVTATSFPALCDSEKLTVVRIEEDDQAQRLFITFNKAAEVGRMILCMDYHGSFNGFYIREFEVEKTKKMLVLGNHHAGEARMCWPCWDEPACKASFRLNLDVPAGIVLLSNMPAMEESELHMTRRNVVFEKSLLLSPQHVCIVGGHLQSVESTTGSGVLVRVHTGEWCDNDPDLALKSIMQLIPYYERYFNRKYPLKKLDAVCMPDEYYEGNVGCILVTEDDLGKGMEQVARIAFHVARLWVENLVTFEWWTYRWLDYGLAALVSIHATEELFLEYDQQSLLPFQEQREWAMSCANQQPLELEVMQVSPTLGFEAGWKEGLIHRSTALLYMLECAIGQTCFQAGIRKLIQTREYKNHHPHVLWDMLPELYGLPVRDVLESWTGQAGFPVLMVSVEGDTLEKIKIEQRPFEGHGGDTKWLIPFSCCWGMKGPKRIANYLLAERCMLLNAPPGVLWVKANAGESGLFRVLYNDKALELIGEAVRDKQVDVVDRLGLLADMLAFCRAGQEDRSKLVYLMKAYEGENSNAVLSKMKEVETWLEI